MNNSFAAALKDWKTFATLYFAKQKKNILKISQYQRTAAQTESCEIRVFIEQLNPRREPFIMHHRW